MNCTNCEDTAKGKFFVLVQGDRLMARCPRCKTEKPIYVDSFGRVRFLDERQPE